MSVFLSVLIILANKMAVRVQLTNKFIVSCLELQRIKCMIKSSIVRFIIVKRMTIYERMNSLKITKI